MVCRLLTITFFLMLVLFLALLLVCVLVLLFVLLIDLLLALPLQVLLFLLMLQQHVAQRGVLCKASAQGLDNIIFIFLHLLRLLPGVGWTIAV